MGFIDKAKDLASQHPDKVDQGVDKIGDAFDQRTGGTHSEQTDKVQDMARDRLHGEGGAPEGEQPPA